MRARLHESGGAEDKIMALPPEMTPSLAGAKVEIVIRYLRIKITY